MLPNALRLHQHHARVGSTRDPLDRVYEPLQQFKPNDITVVIAVGMPPNGFPPALHPGLCSRGSV